jgi:hypothetical protein
MKKLAFLFYVTLSIVLLYCCDYEQNLISSEFQLFGDDAEIPILYFYDYVNDKAVISGYAKGHVDIELIAENNTECEISGVFHLGYSEVGKYYKDDIYSQEFALKKGETFKYSGDFTFYGEIFDNAFILVDIKAKSISKLNSCPVRIVKSDVYLKTK